MLGWFDKLNFGFCTVRTMLEYVSLMSYFPYFRLNFSLFLIACFRNGRIRSSYPSGLSVLAVANVTLILTRRL